MTIEKTERLTHFKKTLGRLYTSMTTTGTTENTAAEVLYHSVISHLDPENAPKPSPPTDENPIGYVVIFEDGRRMGKTVYETSGICNAVFSSPELARKTFLQKIKETNVPYFIAPVYAVDLTPINN